MAVTSTAITRSGPSGSHKLSGEREYTIEYQVETSSINDDPVIVIAGLPVKLGASYASGNGSDTQAFLEEITPRRSSVKSTLWYVTTIYRRKKTDEQGQDDDGNQTTDPLEFRDEVNIDKAQFTRPVVKARNITPLPGRDIGTIGPPTNSAGVPYIPPPERDSSRRVLRVTKNLLSYPSSIARLYRDVVNTDRVTWNWPGKNFTLDPLSGKIAPISGSLQRKNDIDFWRVTYEIHTDEEFGWRLDLPDTGVVVSARAGDPDGRGGIISPSDIMAGQAEVRQLTSPDGTPITEPVLLDGKGQPLAAGLPAVYLTYQIYVELPFARLDLDV